jgi:hypothetical protein
LRPSAVVLAKVLLKLHPYYWNSCVLKTICRVLAKASAVIAAALVASAVIASVLLK